MSDWPELEFKSVFARSLIAECNSRRKSPEATNHERRSDYDEKAEEDDNDCDYQSGCEPIFANVSKSANVSPVKSLVADNGSNKPPLATNKKGNQVSLDRPDEILVVHSKSHKEMSLEREVLKLQTKCQRWEDECSKYRKIALRNEFVRHWQSQIDMLQWQLKLTESGRQMHRTVVEHVSKFLERIHENLDVISSKMSTSPKTKKRSRSLHTMGGATYVNTNGKGSRSSFTPLHNSTATASNSWQTWNSSMSELIHELDMPLVESSNDVTLIEDSWKPTSPQREYITLDKVSQELLRFNQLLQSLLNTGDPNLIHRLTPAASEVTLPDSNEKTDNNSVGSCASLFQSTSPGNRKSVDASSSSCSARFTLTDELQHVPIKMENSSTKQPNVEGESGFSSMSSFHDVSILPEMKTYPEIGVPIVHCDESKHRRWNSAPDKDMYDNVVSFCDDRQIASVFWV